MPYKDSKRYQQYMRDYMKKYRRQRRETVRSLSAKQKQQIKKVDVKLYRMLFGKKERKT